jgi:hypothetical protein
VAEHAGSVDDARPASRPVSPGRTYAEGMPDDRLLSLRLWRPDLEPGPRRRELMRWTGLTPVAADYTAEEVARAVALAAR